ncbi:hypothetical protein CIY_19880 [Butyrivibrio fibrisolvens 16/4]|nr:hypothetical protein CIY_19880 [Butyrivibrio fibrisolvens 16/4]
MITKERSRLLSMSTLEQLVIQVLQRFRSQFLQLVFQSLQSTLRLTQVIIIHVVV